jgi:diadenosine tetraphosphate (Ap4A) HIT family hydrolase
MNREGVVVQEWPGGLYTAAGGTRTQINLSRPWQKEMTPDPATCPFETREQDALRDYVRDYEFGGGWRVLGNRRTPFPLHRLIIPTRCWEAEKLYRLGGEEELTNALTIAAEQISEQGAAKVLLSCHIGWLAGQNLAHFHIHDLDTTFYAQGDVQTSIGTDAEVELLLYAFERKNLSIMESDTYRVVAGGHRAGQCFILPKQEPYLLENQTATLAVLLLAVIDLYAERFKSTERLPPHYMVGLKIRDGYLCYGFYVPILNHWGATEYFGLLGEQPLILPWPHEETVRHLLTK